MTGQLVLLGAGLAHLHLLKHLAQHPLQGAQVTLVSARTRLIHAPMVAGFLTGRQPLDNCAIDLGPLIQRSGVRWLRRTATAVDPQARTVLLDDGHQLPFDTMSINGQLAQSRNAVETAMPGARQNAMLAWPLDAFCQLWPRVTELADAQAKRIAVICNSLQTADFGSGIELALAIRQRLPGSAVTLLTGGATLENATPKSLESRLAGVLRQRNITVLADAVVGIAPGEVTLASGARLACDVPLVLNSAVAPVWVAESGMALDSQGAVAVDAFFRSTSHPQVFAPPPDGFHTVAGQADSALLCRNLLAAVANQPLTPWAPGSKRLKLVSCGDTLAIAQWGPYSAQGRWASWLKHDLDRRLIAHYKKTVNAIESNGNNLKPSL